MTSTRELPQIFGRYVLTQLLGEGGMAEVYLATVRVAEGLIKRVVIKKIRKEFADHPEFTRMFVDEAKIALSLNHANIVQVFDFGQVRGAFYLAMELVEGTDLMRLFYALKSRQEVFPPVIAAYVAHQVSAGLAYAHRKTDDYGRPLGIVHRDVSPHNIMVSFEGQVKILDFGIARTKERALETIDPHDDSAEETIKGKVAYMSPEQALGRPVDHRSDVYSLGIVLHELLSGNLLFRTKDRLLALDRVRTEAVPPIRTAAADVPDQLAAIVDRALERDPDRRFESARALQSELASYLHRADPVVDDEVLSNFMAQYRAPTTVLRGGGTYEQHATRELGDSHGSQFPAVPRRQTQRVVVVHVALQSERETALGTAPDPTAFITLARDIAFKREAHVVRADARGIVLALGAVLGSGDDAERGVRLALALREEVAESAPGVAVGIVVASVPVVIHHGGTSAVDVDLRTGVSEELDAVSRHFMDGPVVVSADLVERLSRTWRFSETSFDPGDGIEIEPELRRAARLVGPVTESENRVHHVPGGRVLLYGRELELKSLRDAFSEAIRTRESRAMFIVGGPGIGKRALAERFVASLPRSACWVLRAAGSWSRRNVPMGVFLDLLTTFLGIERDTTTGAIAAMLRQHDVSEADSLAQALATAVGVSDAADITLDPLERRDRLWKLVRRLTRGLSQRRPVLMLIENVHFVDEPSMSFLREWVRVRHPVPVLVISTGRPPGPHADALRRQPNMAVLELDELDEHARRELIVRRFEDPAEAETLAAAVLAHTGGHPLFIEETLASLLHAGVIGWNAQGRYLVVQQPGAKIEVPPSIEAALQARIDDLSPADREVLRGAATLGRVFQPGEVGLLLQRSVAKSLENLIAANLLERDASPSPLLDAMRFTTVSLHEVCKASIPDDIAQLLHSRAADIKRARDNYTVGRDDGPLAEHLIEAGRLEEAVDHALRAAADAREVAGNVEAYHYLSQALRAMAADDPRRFEALLDRESILRAWGRRRARGADIRQMLRLAEALGDPEREAVASLRLLRLYVEAGRYQGAERLLPRIEERIGSLAVPDALLPVVGELKSALSLARGHFEEAEAFAREALSHCLPDERGTRQRCRLYRALGKVMLEVGQPEQARSEYERALELTRELRERRLEADVLNSLGEVAGRSTHYQVAIDHFKAALQIDRDLGDRFATGRKLANLGVTYATVGMHRRAERCLRKSLELHEAVGDPGEYNDVAVHLGEVLVAIGNLEAGRTLLLEAAEVAKRRGDHRTELRALTRVALMLAGSDNDDERSLAASLAQRALVAAREHGLRTAAARALHVLALLAAKEGAVDVAIEHERDAVRLVRAGAAPRDGVRSIHHLGKLLRGRGETGEAQALLREAAVQIRGRLEELRDPELRSAYMQLPIVQRIFVDGENEELDESEDERAG